MDVELHAHGEGDRSDVDVAETDSEPEPIARRRSMRTRGTYVAASDEEADAPGRDGKTSERRWKETRSNPNACAVDGSSEEETNRRSRRKRTRTSEEGLQEHVEKKIEFETYSTRYGRVTRRASEPNLPRTRSKSKINDREETVRNQDGAETSDEPVSEEERARVRRSWRKRQNVDRYSPTRAGAKAQADAYNRRMHARRSGSRRYGRYRPRPVRLSDSEEDILNGTRLGRNFLGGLFYPPSDAFAPVDPYEHDGGQHVQEGGTGLCTPSKAAGTGAARTGFGVPGGGLFEKPKNAEITPVHVDPNVSFSDIGGLAHYVKALKEMIFLPLVYPEVFARFRIYPPRGVLLYGPPGTGKTLTARALAATASKAGQQVTFFMRKGADILSQWVGEAERQLRVLFAEAEKHQPSIIFFDEIDGLAPVRSSRQDQIHNSIVSTLLALMDGLDSRGQVVVIGATNRIDAIDGALRRPGRFDRELLFPLPDYKARVEILNIHTRGWEEKPEEGLLHELAASCVGYCGADLKALCTEAAVHSLRRSFPQIYETELKLVLDPSAVRVTKKDFLAAQQSITPAAHRSATLHARPIPQLLHSLLSQHLHNLVSKVKRIFPPAQNMIHEDGPATPKDTQDLGVSDKDANGIGIEEHLSPDPIAQSKVLLTASHHLHAARPRLLLCGESGEGQVHIAPGLLHALEMFPVQAIGMSSLVSNTSARSSEEALVLAVSEARRAAPAILYLPQLQQWWENAAPTLRSLLWVLLQDLPPSLPVLLLATADAPLHEIDGDARDIFGEFVYELSRPSAAQRSEFFESLAIAVRTPAQVAMQQEVRTKPPPLPEAPVLPREPSKEEMELKAFEEQQVLRRLRMVLREVILRLMESRKWSIFVDPPELEETEAVPDALLDLSSFLRRVNDGWFTSVSKFQKEMKKFVQAVTDLHGEEHIQVVSKAHALNDTVDEMLLMIDPELVRRAAAIDEQGGPMRVEVKGPVHQSVSKENHQRVSRSSRLRGESVGRWVLHKDPEALLRKLREQKRHEDHAARAEVAKETLTEERQGEAKEETTFDAEKQADELEPPRNGIEVQEQRDESLDAPQQNVQEMLVIPDPEVVVLSKEWKHRLVQCTADQKVESLEKLHADLTRILVELKAVEDRKVVVQRLNKYLASRL